MSRQNNTNIITKPQENGWGTFDRMQNILNQDNNGNDVKPNQNNRTFSYSSPVDFNVGNGVLGSYDNIKLRTQCGWMAPPCDVPPKSNLQFLPQGTPLPLGNEIIYSQLPTDSMFVFANSYSSPSCNSQYSTDRGQVCMPQSLSLLMQSRGGNKTYENYNF